MANVNNPSGFRPLNGVCVRPPTRYRIETTYSEDLFIGDMVTLSGGYCIKATAAASPILGAIVGFECTNGGLKAGGYYPDDSPLVWDAIVADDPSQRFVGQDDGDSTAIDQADIGNTGILIFTHTGNKYTNLSGMELDSNTFTTGAEVTDPMRLIGILETPGNAWGANGEYIVEIHNHYLRQENNVDAVT